MQRLPVHAPPATAREREREREMRTLDPLNFRFMDARLKNARSRSTPAARLSLSLLFFSRSFLLDAIPRYDRCASARRSCVDNINITTLYHPVSSPGVTMHGISAVSLVRYDPAPPEDPAPPSFLSRFKLDQALACSPNYAAVKRQSREGERERETVASDLNVHDLPSACSSPLTPNEKVSVRVETLSEI